jgi:hypothetical protein
MAQEMRNAAIEVADIAAGGRRRRARTRRGWIVHSDMERPLSNMFFIFFDYFFDA